MSKIENPEDEDFLQDNLDDDSEDEDIEDEDLDDSEDDDSEDDDEEEDDSDPKSKDARAKLNAQNRFLKKEGYEFINGKWVKPTSKKPDTKVDKKSSKKESVLSNSDMFVLIKANVPEEDIPEVQDYARMKGVTIKEALQTNFVKTLLSDKAEERATADAAHTGSSRRTTGKKSISQVLSDAEKGDLPDDPAVLAQARFAKKKADKDHRKR